MLFASVCYVSLGYHSLVTHEPLHLGAHLGLAEDLNPSSWATFLFWLISLGTQCLCSVGLVQSGGQGGGQSGCVFCYLVSVTDNPPEPIWENPSDFWIGCGSVGLLCTGRKTETALSFWFCFPRNIFLYLCLFYVLVDYLFSSPTLRDTMGRQLAPLHWT